MVRTRIAPSPTGYPHIGTIYQALFDYAFAKKNNGQFLIRIEDTDRNRFIADGEEKIYEAMDWFGFQEDESSRRGGENGPYRQSERLSIYNKYIADLIEKKGAYYCFCTKERLDSMRLKQQEDKKPMIYDKHCRLLTHEEVDEKLTQKIPWVIRLKIPDVKTITARDEIRGDVSFQADLLEDTILIKSDGFPTYHFASMVDDHLMKITHVVRGEEWLPSLPKNILIYEYFDWKKPLFFHTPVLRNPDKSKLSKRHGHTNIVWYKEEGFLPEAILNFLAHLGWTHPEEKEIFSLQEFIALVDLKAIKAVAPIFDIKKLTWMNGMYIRTLAPEILHHLLVARYPSFAGMSLERQKILLPLVQSRMNTLKEFATLTNHFFSPPTIIVTMKEKEIASLLYKKLQLVSDWNATTIFSILYEVLKIFTIKMSVFYKLITGEERGLPLPDTMVILGKEEVLQRLKTLCN